MGNAVVRRAKLVDAIRRFVYPHAARVANKWQRLLQEQEMYPITWDGFQTCCADAGQTTPSPLLLRYEAGGFNALHQDLRGEVYFPLQLVIVLSPRAESVTGVFLANYCDDVDLLNMVQLHDEPYALGRKYEISGCDENRLARLLDTSRS